VSVLFVSVTLTIITLDFLMMVMTTSVSGVVSVVVPAALVNELEQHVEAMQKKKRRTFRFL
jgi:uncharacterized membrane protein